MNIKLVDLKRQFDPIKKDIYEEFDKIFDNTSFIMGENVKKFEEEFSSYIGVKHSISVGNGTDALVIALKSLGIKEGDEVITTPYTFFATCESISRVGATPVFVDVSLESYNIDVTKIEEKITPKTKAILPVHIFGQPCDMVKINEIAKKHNLYVVEDACQAVGAMINDKKVGSLSDIACFSFFPTKNLGCAGDGGIITTNNDELATICRAYRTHGSGKDGCDAYCSLTGENLQIEDISTNDNTVYNPMKYFNYLVGYNSRLDEIQAAILRKRFKYLDEYNDDRINTAKYYNEMLKNTSLIVPKTFEGFKHIYHLYILQSDKRDELTKYLNEKGIATGIYYKVPMHLQKAMLKYNYKENDCPNAEYLSKRTFAIPMFPLLSSEEKKYIVDTIIEWDEKYGK